MGNNEKLQEITNSSISDFCPFANICSCLVKFVNIQFIVIKF